MPTLSERYRPTKLEDLVGQAKVVKTITRLQDGGGLEGRVFWLVGNSGGGKTSCARIIARNVADDFTIREEDAQNFTMDYVRDIEVKVTGRPLGGKCWVFICNEAHRLSDRVVSYLQTVLETEGAIRNATFLFTTTTQGQEMLFADKFDACPFLSRATILSFETRGEQLILDYACHVRKIAQAEGCDGKPISDYIDLIKKCKLNLRQALNQIEAGCMLD